MTARIRADFWVSAYLRRRAAEGLVAVLRWRGHAEAGSILVKIDRLDGTALLYGPAPPDASDDRGGERLFERLLEADAATVEARLARERRFDPDLWLVEIEDRAGRADLPEPPLTRQP
jgi:hypothetical protein